MNIRPFWLLCLLLCFSIKGYSQYTVITDINDSIPRIAIGKDLLIYQSNHLANAREAINAQYVHAGRPAPNLGMNPFGVWVKFSLLNKGQKPTYLLKIANATIDEVELYTYDSFTRSFTDSTLISKNYPFGARKYKDPNYIFDLQIDPGETKTYYVHIRSKMPVILPTQITQPQFAASATEYIFSGGYLGIVIIMVVYNFFLYLSIRDKSYIYYVLYVLGTGLTQMGLKGYNFQFLWPNAPGFEHISIILFACLSGIAALFFTVEFLEIKKHFRKIYRLIQVFIGLFVLGIVALFFNTDTAFVIMQLGTAATSIGIFIISLYIILKKPSISSARYFLVAWSVLIAGSLIFILKDFGVLPYNSWTTNVVQVASAIEMSLLSFGLANRINILKREKEQSRLEALRVARENSRIIKEQNLILESKVKERTEELVTKNGELNRTLDDLQQAQMQLVEAEKMASLGQLTAGIAHEINNPINFVTGNIGPLKRDVDVLWKTIEMLEHFNTQNISDEEKRRLMSLYKEEQDLDYLQMEINHLLKGIKEGASRTAEIVKSLRIFSRLDEADLKMADINEGIESTIIIVNNMLSHISVIKRYGRLPLVHCYPGKLNQVFLNIITNALYAINEKFGERSGGELIIETICDNDNVYITFEDNGTGMTEETKRKIFDPFFTTKDVGQGTGLGMSIAFNTIQKHSGHIAVTTELGKGTRFILQIPVHAMQQKD